MNAWAVGIKAATIALLVIREGLIFGDQVHHVEAQAVNATIGPELTNFFQLVANRWVFPVEIGLLGGKQVQIILTTFGVPLPGVTAKLGSPVVWWCVRRAVAPDIELAVGTVLFARLFKPGVVG